MKVTYQIDTDSPGDLALLLSIQAAFKARSQTYEVAPEPKPKSEPKPKFELKPEPKPKPKTQSKPEPKFESMDFSEMIDYLESIEDLNVSHCRFLAKTFLRESDDPQNAKKMVVAALRDSKSPTGRFEDLSNFTEFVSCLKEAKSRGSVSNDDDLPF